MTTLNGSEILCVTYEPSCRIIYGNGSTGHTHLFFPHTNFIVVHRTAHPPYLGICFTQTPLVRNFDQFIFGLPLFNICDRHFVCLGEDRFRLAGNSAKESARLLINAFWSSRFCAAGVEYDYWKRRYTSDKPEFQRQWKEMTLQRNSEWIIKESLLQSSYRNLESMIRCFLGCCIHEKNISDFGELPILTSREL